MIKNDKLTVFAPAKVNLHLAVKNKREDGFHGLESVFLALDFGDLLHFEVLDAVSDEITMRNHAIPMPNNIIYKAITLFRKKTGFSQGLKVTAEKRIPLGGGLGGGSSNAASTLLALNEICRVTSEACSRETLLEMAASLGSDVPFFVHETPAALVTGRGEIIEPVNMPSMSLVLINPGFSSDTARAFRLLDEKRSNKEEFTQRRQEHQGFGLNMKEFFNDFLDVFPEEEQSIYNEIISALQSQGAQYANLSGSGATCFGVFEDKDQAQKAADTLRGKWDFIEVCSSK